MEGPQGGRSCACEEWRGNSGGFDSHVVEWAPGNIFTSTCDRSFDRSIDWLIGFFTGNLLHWNGESGRWNQSQNSFSLNANGGNQLGRSTGKFGSNDRMRSAQSESLRIHGEYSFWWRKQRCPWTGSAFTAWITLEKYGMGLRDRCFYRSWHEADAEQQKGGDLIVEAVATGWICQSADFDYVWRFTACLRGQWNGKCNLEVLSHAPGLVFVAVFG